MRMRCQLHPECGRSLPDLVESLGNNLDLRIVRLCFGAAAERELEMLASERLDEVAGEGDMVLDHFRDLVFRHECGGRAAGGAGAKKKKPRGADHRAARRIAK